MNDGVATARPGSRADDLGFDVERVRAEFPILALKVNGKPLVFLDNAASSQMPQPVIDRYVRYRSSELAASIPGVYRVEGSPRREILELLFPLRDEATLGEVPSRGPTPVAGDEGPS